MSEPADLVLTLLREIRVTQDDHSRQLDAIGVRLDRLHARMTAILRVADQAKRLSNPEISP